MTIQTKLRTNEIIPNSNMCFHIGTILAVKKQYEKLGFSGQKLENFEADERAVSSIKSNLSNLGRIAMGLYLRNIQN